MVRAPPIEPGIPEKNAAGPISFFSANNAKSIHEAPTSARQEFSAAIVILFIDFFVEITTPLMPPSLTRTLVPLPNQVTELPLF